MSIDIFNKGNDKSRVIHRVLNDKLETHNIVFVGDRIPFLAMIIRLLRFFKIIPTDMLLRLKNGKIP